MNINEIVSTLEELAIRVSAIETKLNALAARDAQSK